MLRDSEEADTLATHYRTQRFSYVSGARLSGVLFVALSIATAAVLLSDSACSPMFRFWNVLAVARSGFLALFSAFVVHTWTIGEHGDPEIPPPPWARWCIMMHRVTWWCSLPLFVAGHFLILSGSLDSACRSSAVFPLDVALLIIMYMQIILPIVIISLMFAALVCCMPILFAAFIRFHAARRSDARRIDALINALPSERFVAVAGAADEAVCSICLNEFEPGDSVRRLQCPGRHMYHQACIDPWLRINGTCPVDRHEVFPRSNADSGADARSQTTSTARAPHVLTSHANSRLPVTGSDVVVVSVINGGRVPRAIQAEAASADDATRAATV